MTGREDRGEQDARRESLREAAADRIRDLPAETALGGSDQAAMGDRAGREAPDADLEVDATGRVEGIADMKGTGTRAPLGDQSTEGEAAREAIGAEPGRTNADPALGSRTGDRLLDEVIDEEEGG